MRLDSPGSIERPWSLHQILPLRDPCKQRKQKEFKSQREWKTTRKQDLLNQYDEITYELTETGATQGLHRSIPDMYISVSIGFLSLRLSEFLFDVPSLGLFSFCYLVSSNSDVLVFILSYML